MNITWWKKKDLPSFPTEHEAAVFLRDHEVTRGLLMPMSDLARSLCEGKMQGADTAAAEIIKALRKNDQWEIARVLLDELSKNARTPDGADLAQTLNDSERREWWSQKAQQFIVDDLPVLVLSTLISGGIGIGARTLALTAKWGPKAARGVQLTAELLSFVPTERVLNDVINNRRADWSAYGMARDYLMTAASFGLFYTLGVCWRAWRTPPKVVSDAAKTAATPKGRPKEIPAKEKAKENINALNRENESAVILRENNYPIEQNPVIPGSNQPGVKKPDYRIGGILFDNHAPNTNSARSIWTTAEGKVHSQQARRLVINLADSKVNVAALQKQFAEWPIEGLEQVLVITKDKKILSLRLAKPFTNFTPKGYPDQSD
ncbi:MAG TPA: hypothetical protein VEY88_24350 [Archangium sp.]|nr:hypothetical protein [Archangium sp.]